MTDGPEVFDDELTAAADRLARLAAGDDDASYVPLFMTAYNAAHAVQTADVERRPDRAAAMLDQLSTVSRADGAPAAEAGELGMSIQSDPVYLANQRQVITLNVRITGGQPAPGVLDCVAVGSENDFCC